MHRKKVEEMQAWFEQFQTRCTNTQSSILLISGPSGSGKTSCIRSLCDKNDIQIVSGYDFKTNTNLVKRQSSRSVAYPSLSLVPDYVDGPPPIIAAPKKVILIDDLPNEDATECLDEVTKEVLQNCLQMILIVTDPCDHHSICDDVILRKVTKMPITSHVQVNSVAPTYIKRLLKQHDLNACVQSVNSLGDVRAAIVDTIFGTLGERDLSIGLFHTVGKILYPKKDKDRTGDVAVITESNRSLFHKVLHANYLYHLDGVESMAKVADIFSWIDCISWDVRNDHRWESDYSSLPELIISKVVNDGPQRRRKFRSITGARFHKTGFE